jgi:hypothetical protein
MASASLLAADSTPGQHTADVHSTEMTGFPPHIMDTGHVVQQAVSRPAQATAPPQSPQSLCLAMYIFPLLLHGPALWLGHGAGGAKRGGPLNVDLTWPHKLNPGESLGSIGTEGFIFFNGVKRVVERRDGKDVYLALGGALGSRSRLALTPPGHGPRATGRRAPGSARFCALCPLLLLLLPGGTGAITRPPHPRCPCPTSPPSPQSHSLLAPYPHPHAHTWDIWHRSQSTRRAASRLARKLRAARRAPPFRPSTRALVAPARRDPRCRPV